MLTWLLASVALAHGGEDHGKAPAPVASVQGEVHALGALGDAFEVVLKHPAHGEGGKTPLRVFVAEADSNAPVSGAQVELTLTGPSVQALKPRMESPGVYLAEAELPVEAEFVAVATVTQGDTVDVLALGTVHLEPEEVAAASSPGSSKARSFVVLIAGLVALALGAWWKARLTRRATS
jgi:phosphate/sulfate permease